MPKISRTPTITLSQPQTRVSTLYAGCMATESYGIYLPNGLLALWRRPKRSKASPANASKAPPNTKKNEIIAPYCESVIGQSNKANCAAAPSVG